MQKYEKVFSAGGKEVKVTSGNFGFRADSAIMVQQGESVVMVFVTIDTKETSLDYFPLGINYVEKHYAGGIISGSRFIKRESRPSDDAIIKGRVIDRAMRPLFPEGFRREVTVVVNVLAYDGENDPALLGANAAALAVHLSSVPFEGPVASIRIGVDENGGLIVNPYNSALEKSKLNAVISCTDKAITQLEIEGDQIDEDTMQKAFDLAYVEAQPWIKAMNEIKAEIGKEKVEFAESKVNPEIVEKYKNEYFDQIKEALFDDDNRNARLDALKADAISKNENEEIREIDIINAFSKIEKGITRSEMLNGNRLSGRKLDEIRELEIVAPYLPRVHGSAMFRRGITQVLSITTLGSMRLAQTSENFEGESVKRFMHHYSGPNYSFGQAGRYSFYPGNREIGHGALAEKAIKPVLPSEEDFPYAIRVVSEILSQNGSTSMASTCGACLSLMDAGVPIKAPVAGISIGLITKDDEQNEYQLLTDVQDVEDFYGDMDFKVTGTTTGITAIQMDTKLRGVKVDILKSGLTQAKNARNFILSKYNEVLSAPRSEVSIYAPKFESLTIKTDKISMVIGPAGKVIKGILESVENKAEIDIQDNGTVVVTAVDSEIMQKVVQQIRAITDEPEIGKVYKGKIDKIMPYGAFVNVSPSISGLVHVSEIADGFVKDAGEFVKPGQEVNVKIVGMDKEGRLQLSIKRAKSE